MSNITPKQSAFVAEYLIDKNATQAAIRAGYAARSAQEQGARMLSNAMVRAAIDAGLAKLATTLEISAERVQKERARLAFLDPRKLFDQDGRPIPIHLLGEDEAAAIAGLEVTEERGEDGAVVATVRKYRLASKEGSLTALEKHFGLTEKRVNFNLPPVAEIASCATAQQLITEAVASGALLASEGQALSSLVEGQRRALETSDLAARLEAIENRLGELK